MSSNYVENILIILSNLPTGLRSSIIKNRLDEFVSIDHEQRSLIIKDILVNYKKIENLKIESLLDSWINSLAGMTSQNVFIVLYSYISEINANPSVLDDLDRGLLIYIISILNNLPKIEKLKLLDCLFESILNTYNPKKFFKVVPVDLLQLYNL